MKARRTYGRRRKGRVIDAHFSELGQNDQPTPDAQEVVQAQPLPKRRGRFCLTKRQAIALGLGAFTAIDCKSLPKALLVTVGAYEAMKIFNWPSEEVLEPVGGVDAQDILRAVGNAVRDHLESNSEEG